MKAGVSEAIYRLGLSGALGWRHKGHGIIFMLHSIVNDANEYLKDSLHCSVDTLEMALRWSRKEGLDFVGLDEAIDRLRRGDDRRFVTFTFDDGYRDNLTRALPLMERYDAPFTVFVTSNMVDRTLYAWWEGLVALLRAYDLVEIEAMDRRFEAYDLTSKSSAVREIKRWVHQDGLRAELLRSTFSAYDIQLPEIVSRLGLSHAELAQLSSHPLVTIGGHTVSHPFLTLSSHASARQEIEENKRFLENITGRAVKHFSYPYGNFGQREMRIVQQAGFTSAVSTQTGNLFPHHAEPETTLALPRESIDPGDSVACLACRTRGAYETLRTVSSIGRRTVAAMR